MSYFNKPSGLVVKLRVATKLFGVTTDGVNILLIWWNLTLQYPKVLHQSSRSHHDVESFLWSVPSPSRIQVKNVWKNKMWFNLDYFLRCFSICTENPNPQGFHPKRIFQGNFEIKIQNFKPVWNIAWRGIVYTIMKFISSIHHHHPIETLSLVEAVDLDFWWDEKQMATKCCYIEFPGKKNQNLLSPLNWESQCGGDE